MPGQMQIGEVAERTGLSLRTIRYYGEVGVAEPSARSQGGFRLYTEEDVQRLQLISQMKPLGLTLEQIAELLGILDRLDEQATSGDDVSREEAAERLALYFDAAQARAAELQGQLDRVNAFSERLRAAARTLAQQPTRP